MRLSRFLPALVVGAVFTATVAPASAATPGVGTTTGTLSVLEIDLGELLELDILQDFAGANTDTDASEAAAAAALNALSVVAPALGVDEQVGLLNVKSTGDEQTANSGDVPVANPVVGGALLPAALSALLDADGAVAGITAGVADLDVLGGLAGLENTQLGIGANSLTEEANGSRRLLIDNLAVLDLGDLLAGLGIPLEALSLETVLGLLDGLGLTAVVGELLDGLGVPIDLENLSVDGILASISGLGELLDPGTVIDDLCTISPLPLGDLCTTVGEPLDDLLAALPAIDTVLDSITGLLGETALLELNALDVGMVTKATDSLDTSLAEVTASLGGISVAGVELPEVDVLDVLETLNATVENLLTTITSDLGLPLVGDAIAALDLVDIGLLEQSTDVAEADEAIVSQATFTGLRLDVAGLGADILDPILGGLAQVGDPVGGLPLDQIPLAPIAGLVGDGEGSPISALSEGLSLRVASLGQNSTFTEVLSNTATPAAPAAPIPAMCWCSANCPPSCSVCPSMTW